MRRFTGRFLRGLFIFMLGSVFGTAFGIAIGFFIFPFVFPPPPAAEQLTEADRSPLAATGTFVHANPSDPVHWGGMVSVYERTVYLEPDFEVGPGPKYPRVSRAECRRPQRESGCRLDVRRSRPLAIVQGQSALFDPGRSGSEEISEPGDLVRGVRRADLARGFEGGELAPLPSSDGTISPRHRRA